MATLVKRCLKDILRQIWFNFCSYLFLQKISIFLILMQFFQGRSCKLSFDRKLISIMSFVRQRIPGQVVPQRLQVQRVVRLLIDRLRVGSGSVPRTRFVLGTFFFAVRLCFVAVGFTAVACAVDVSDAESSLFMSGR